MASQRYTLITAAYNEARFIERTIQSVLAQSVLPARWIIVSDASTDGTDEIVRRYAERHPLISFLRVNEDHVRIPAAQIYAFNAAHRMLDNAEYDFIGNLDADVSFAPDYFAQLLHRFEQNPRLGVAGGVVEDKTGEYRKPLRGEALRAVCQAVQLFRRECFEAIGGYPALHYGASDTYMEVKARMLNWEAESYPDLVVLHHRRTASASGLLRGRVRQGCADFYVGTHPLFEIARCARRLDERPFILGSLLRLSVFFYLYCRRRKAEVPSEFVHFYQGEQLNRLRAWLVPGSRSPLR